MAALIARGQTYLANGDVVSARLVFRRAAEAGDAQAALALGGTYDPLVLRSLGVIGVAADAAQARELVPEGGGTRVAGGAAAHRPARPMDALKPSWFRVPAARISQRAGHCWSSATTHSARAGTIAPCGGNASGTKSRPDVPNGWQRSSRASVIQPPAQKPWQAKASSAYCEQVGRCRQFDPISGESVSR